MDRACTGRKADGSRCLATPLRDSDWCFWHDPAHAAEAAEARRLGGLRRKREGAVAGAYDVQGLGSVAELRRLLEVAVADLLALENSVARARSLIYLTMAAIKLLEVGEHEARLTALEAAVRGQPGYADSIIDAVATEDAVEFEAIVTETRAPEGGLAVSEDVGEGEA